MVKQIVQCVSSHDSPEKPKRGGGGGERKMQNHTVNDIIYSFLLRVYVAGSLVWQLGKCPGVLVSETAGTTYPKFLRGLAIMLSEHTSYSNSVHVWFLCV